METVEYVIHEVLKKGVRNINPFIPEMPAAGPHFVVYNALCNAFFQMESAFSGSVEQFVQLGIEGGKSEAELRTGFEEMARYGHLTFEGDVFTPTQQFLKKLF